MRLAFLIVSAAAAAPLLAQEAAASPRAGRLREVRVSTRDVFAEESAAQRPLESLVNALHWVTREETVRRELWFGPGDVIDDTIAAELERNLRALSLFAEVTVRLVPVAPGEVDLEVRTRDRLTLIFGAGASYLGGVTGVRGAIGENNLFGLGDRTAVSFARNSEGQYRGNFTYTDLHVLDTLHTGNVRYDNTDDGEGFGLTLRRPFKHLADPLSYGFQVDHDELEVDYYRNGDSLAQVPDVRTAFASDLLWGDGPADQRRKLGFVLAAEHNDYDTATGPIAPEIRVPGDTDSVFFGPTASWSWIDRYAKVEGLDTLSYVQDLTLGVELSLTAGARWRREQGAGEAVQPELAASFAWATDPLPGVFTNLVARGRARLDDGDLVGWNGRLAGRAYAMVHDLDTIACNVAFDAIEEKQDLLRELTLGEENGLRGYRAHQFSGTRRLLINLENRFDTGLELATCQLGLLAFFDAGWVGRDDALGHPHPSAGVGLRIGSKELLGGNVLRIDFAKPLDHLPDESNGWQLSVTVGQVFTFGGN